MTQADPAETSPPRKAKRQVSAIHAFIDHLEQKHRWLLTGTSALEALELVLTHAALSERLRPLRDSLLPATRARVRPDRAAVQLRAAADELIRAESLLVDAGVLRLVLLEHAQTLFPSIPLQLDIMRACLRYRGVPDQILEHKVPRMDDQDADGRQRAISSRGLATHAMSVAQQALRAMLPSATRPLGRWTEEELHIATVAIRVLYALCRQSICGTDRREDLDADFRDRAAPVWQQIVREAHRRRDLVHQWSIRWHEEAQAQMLLMLRERAGSPGREWVRDNAEPSEPMIGATAITHVVCRQPIPPSADRHDQQEIDRHKVLQRALPVAPMASLAELDARARDLSTEFPWARDAIEKIFMELRGRAALGVRVLGMPATLLVGTPGSGKSRLARRLAEVLNLPRLDLPLGGTMDSKVLAGTSRGWGAAKPGDLATLIASQRCASALVILDEIDKAGGATLNDGGIQSYLLGLLEPETARRHRDNFLKVECDYSNVLWVATANRLSVLSPALRSRFRVLLVGQPEAAHMPVAAENVIDELAARWGVERAALPDLQQLALPFDRLTSVRQVRQACEAAIANWAANIQRH